MDRGERATDREAPLAKGKRRRSGGRAAKAVFLPGVNWATEFRKPVRARNAANSLAVEPGPNGVARNECALFVWRARSSVAGELGVDVPTEKKVPDHAASPKLDDRQVPPTFQVADDRGTSPTALSVLHSVSGQEADQSSYARRLIRCRALESMLLVHSTLG